VGGEFETAVEKTRWRALHRVDFIRKRLGVNTENAVEYSKNPGGEFQKNPVE
jgi:hypothetical protein